MQMLRRGAMEEVRRNLNRGFLTSHSFTTHFNNEDGTLITVVYSDCPEFSFVLLHPQSATNPTVSWKTTESPGRHFTSAETYDHPRFDQAFNSVYGWADRVGEEIVLEAKTHAGTSMLEELRRNVAKTADNLYEPEKPFTEEELDSWMAQLQSLLSRMNELELKNEIQNGRVEQMSRELETLRKQGTKIPKRTWLKTAGNKILDLLDSTSKAALKTLAEGAVKAMLEYKPGPQ